MTDHGPGLVEQLAGDLDKTPGESAATADQSMISRLRAVREEIQAAGRTIDFPLAAYDAELVVRCRPITADELRRIAGRSTGRRDTRSQTQRVADSHADLMVACCVEVLARADDGDLVQITPGEPSRIDDRLAELLALTASTAREAAIALWGDDLALAAAASKLMKWTTGENRMSDEEFLGE